jgi:hypothetical protein
VTPRAAPGSPIPGPITSGELASIGLETVEAVAALGWEEAFVRWVEAYPERLNVNAAVGLVAVVRGVSWLHVTPNDKARARSLVDALRRERGLPPSAPSRRKRSDRGP